MIRPKGIAGKSFVLFIIAVILLTLPGCWDRREIEQLALVLALGVDKTPQKGLIVTAQIAIPSKLAGDGGGEGPASLVASVEAGTVPGALNLFNAFIARRITLTHARALVISEDLAKDPLALKKIINPLTRYREVRQNINVIIVRGKAKDFLKENQGPIEANPVRFMEGLAESTQYTAMIPIGMFLFFLDGIQGRGSEPYAILGASKPKPMGQEKKPTKKPKTGTRGFIAGSLPREGGAKVELLGTAVFSRGKMVGELNAEETRIFNMLRGTFRRAFMPFTEPPPMKNYFTAHDIKQGSTPDITVKIKNGVPIIQVKLSLEGELMGNQSNVNYATDPKKQKKLEKHISSIIHTRALALIKKAQQDYKSDFFGFGNYARYNFLTSPEWDNYDWAKNFPRAEVHVSVEYRIRRVGLIFGQPETH